MNHDQLWMIFPRTLVAFDKQFPDEEACRAHLIKLRWGGQVRCAKCQHDETWELENGRFECKRCGHQTSVTAGTLLHGTHKPLRVWFRAMWEMAVRKSGINACELQRIMGFGSYGTAWTWLHKLRRAMAARDKSPLTGVVAVDEGYLGGKGEVMGRGTTKELVLVATEDCGRARLERADNASARSIGSFIQRNVDCTGRVLSDGWRGYSFAALDGRRHSVESKVDYQGGGDPLILCHRVLALVKRLWLGTYHGSMSSKHMQAYFEEYTFRFNRRRTDGVGRITSRLLHLAMCSVPVTGAEIIGQPVSA